MGGYFISPHKNIIFYELSNKATKVLNLINYISLNILEKLKYKLQERNYPEKLVKTEIARAKAKR